MDISKWTLDSRFSQHPSVHTCQSPVWHTTPPTKNATYQDLGCPSPSDSSLYNSPILDIWFFLKTSLLLSLLTLCILVSLLPSNLSSTWPVLGSYSLWSLPGFSSYCYYILPCFYNKPSPYIVMPLFFISYFLFMITYFFQVFASLYKEML